MTDDRNKYTTSHTSVRVHHAPGGQSNFSLGWGQDEEEKKPALTPDQEDELKKKKDEEDAKKKAEEERQKKELAERPPAGSRGAGPTGRYGGQPPGGKSSITFG